MYTSPVKGISVWSFLLKSVVRLAPSLCDVLVVVLIASAEHQNPAVVEVPVVLEVNGRRCQLVTAIALRWADDAGFGQIAVYGIMDVDIASHSVGVTVGLASVLIVQLMLDAEQQIVALTEDHLLADEVQAAVTGFVIVVCTVAYTAEGAGGGIHGNRLSDGKAIDVVVPAIGEAAFPIIAQLVLEHRAGALSDTASFGPAFIQTFFVVDVGWMAVDEYRAAVEWRGVIVVLV